MFVPRVLWVSMSQGLSLVNLNLVFMDVFNHAAECHLKHLIIQ